MVIANFPQLKLRLQNLPPKTAVVAAAHDEHTLQAVFNACQDGLIQPILVGHRAQILSIAQRLGAVLDPTQVVDAQDIPYADGSYDAITMAYGIRNMPDRPRALAEMFRVLKPGGALVCLEFSTPPSRIWRALYHFYLRHLIPFWGGLITGDKEGFVYLAKSIRAFPDQEGLADMMREAGFTDVTWKNYTGGIAAVHVARKPE